MLDDIFDGASDTSGGSKYEPPTFSLNSGMQVIGKDKAGKPVDKPKQLPTWRFVSEDKKTLDALAELYGGTVEEWETTKKTGLHVITDATEVEIVVASPDDIESNLILWGPNGPAHKCNGKVYTSRDEDEGQACGCEKYDLQQLKDRAESGKGGKPFTEIEFTLAGKGEDLGKGKFTNGGSWPFAKEVTAATRGLKALGEPALVAFRKEFVSFTTDAGQLREYYKTALEVQGSYANAISED